MTNTKESSAGFSKEEKAAMKERAKELKASALRADGLKDVLDKIAGMEARDRAIAEKVHELITAAAPDLAPRTWYGSPAYANDGTVILFFQESSKFKTRYCTLGFSDAAQLDDGSMWPTSYGILNLTPADEKQITALVKKAAG